MLTRKQSLLLRFIQAFMEKNAYAPSYDEMMTATGESSKSGIYRLIKGLEQRGFIRRLPYQARAIELVRKIEFN